MYYENPIRAIVKPAFHFNRIVAKRKPYRNDNVYCIASRPYPVAKSAGQFGHAIQI